MQNLISKLKEDAYAVIIDDNVNLMDGYSPFLTLIGNKDTRLSIWLDDEENINNNSFTCKLVIRKNNIFNKCFYTGNYSSLIKILNENGIYSVPVKPSLSF
jgi:hypothetical protein